MTVLNLLVVGRRKVEVVDGLELKGQSEKKIVNWRTNQNFGITFLEEEEVAMRRIRRRLNGKGWGFLSPASFFVFVYIFAVFITQANGKLIRRF